MVRLDQIMDWIASANFAVREEPDATEVFEFPGGEIRFYVRANSGVFTISEAQRSGDERFVFSSDDESLVLKQLVFALRGSARARIGLPTLSIPAALNDLPAGFSIDTPSVEVDVLKFEGREIARLSSGSGLYPAVRFAQVANAPTELIKTSLLAPDGAPLFSA